MTLNYYLRKSKFGDDVIPCLLQWERNGTFLGSYGFGSCRLSSGDFFLVEAKDNILNLLGVQQSLVGSEGLGICTFYSFSWFLSFIYILLTSLKCFCLLQEEDNNWIAIWLPLQIMCVFFQVRKKYTYIFPLLCFRNLALRSQYDVFKSALSLI